MSLQVKDYMHAPVVAVSPEAGLDRALNMMRTKVIRHLPVVESGNLVGIVTDRDLRLAMEGLDMEGPDKAPKGLYLPALRKIRAIMTTEVLTVVADDPIERAVELMKSHKIGGLPVVEPGTRKVIGMITETDLLLLLSRLLKEKRA